MSKKAVILQRRRKVAWHFIAVVLRRNIVSHKYCGWLYNHVCYSKLMDDWRNVYFLRGWQMALSAGWACEQSVRPRSLLSPAVESTRWGRQPHSPPIDLDPSLSPVPPLFLKPFPIFPGGEMGKTEVAKTFFWYIPPLHVLIFSVKLFIFLSWSILHYLHSLILRG